jgi:thiol:disulfide interchange protein DsbC
MSAFAFASRIARGLFMSLSMAVPASASAAESDFPHNVLKGIEAMRRLPADGFHVVESQGRLLLVSTNGHYVVTGGRILDLWNQVEVKSVADVEGTLRLPLARMGIEAKALGGITAGQLDSAQKVTAFLDPGSAESRKLLPLLRELGKQYRIDVVFVPAQPARAGISRALICDRQAALVFVNESRAPPALPDSNSCGEKELERARVTVQLLGISSLPFTVSPNGAGVAGTPKNYAAFVTANLESP